MTPATSTSSCGVGLSDPPPRLAPPIAEPFHGLACEACAIRTAFVVYDATLAVLVVLAVIGALRELRRRSEAAVRAQPGCASRAVCP